MTGSDPCVFCRIARGEIPSTVVNRTEGFLAIEDLAPKAPVHLLVLPERHIETFREIALFRADESKRMLEFVAETATVSSWRTTV